MFLLTLAGLPFFTFLLGRFVTHAMEPRHSLGAMMGLAALVAIAVEPLLRRQIAGSVLLLLLFAGTLWMGVERIGAVAAARREALANTVLPEQIRAAMMQSPTKMLYTQDIDLLGFLAFHETDPTLLAHIVLVYSRDEEMRWIHSGSDSRTVTNLKSFTTYNIVPYESVIQGPGGHLFVVTHGGWNWSDKAFASGEVQVTSVGRAFGGDVVLCAFRRLSKDHLLPWIDPCSNVSCVPRKDSTAVAALNDEERVADRTGSDALVR